MSKRTTSPDSPTPTPRRRKTAPQAEAPSAAPKTTRTRRKAAEPAVLEAEAFTMVPVNGGALAAITSVNHGPSYEEIATRAYFIALERGFQSDPVADWLLAEQELRGSLVQS
jgi:Protein of unknown function (DUF2934)